MVHRYKMKGDFDPTINELTIRRGNLLNNAPINEKEGNKSMAALERSTAKNLKAAISLLQSRGPDYWKTLSK